MGSKTTPSERKRHRSVAAARSKRFMIFTRSKTKEESNCDEAFKKGMALTNTIAVGLDQVGHVLHPNTLSSSETTKLAESWPPHRLHDHGDQPTP